MSKIVEFKSYNDNALKFLDNVKRHVEEEKIDNIMIVCKLDNGEVLTGATKNLDWGTRMELIGHLHADVIDRMIKQNYITP